METHRCLSNNNNQTGFSVLELIIVVAIFSIVMAGIFGAVQITETAVNKGTDKSSSQASSRIFLDRLTKEVMQSSLIYTQSTSPSPTDTYDTVPTCPTNPCKQYLYYRKPSLFDANGNPTRWDYICYYLAKPTDSKGIILFTKDLNFQPYELVEYSYRNHTSNNKTTVPSTDWRRQVLIRYVDGPSGVSFSRLNGSAIVEGDRIVLVNLTAADKTQITGGKGFTKVTTQVSLRN